ncbi:MAG: mannanase, partial [Melioribacteraceae bacterium]|nr:mannanase [Melioribacteraceae bacterium]
HQFVKDGKPYYFMGTNFWYGWYLGSPGETGDRERLIRELDFLFENNITNLRVLASSEESSIKNSLKPAIQISPGNYNEDLLEGLDFLLSEMGKRDMHAIVFLNNYWEWSGGFSQYGAWFGRDTALDLGDPNVTWPQFSEHAASFYSNKEATEYFREYIKMIVTRKNKFTGDYYFEDPTIMAWQLANEPRPGQGEDGIAVLPSFYDWIDKTAEYIHLLAPNQLVTTGNEGSMGSLGSFEYYEKAHSSKWIDYLTFHMWAKNWSWYDAEKPEETFPSTKIKATQYLKDHIKLAGKIGKPLTLEEFGLGRDNEQFAIGTSTNYRDKYYQMVFDLVLDSASVGGPIAGTNFWTWGGEGRALHDDFWWQKGDPFTGDPPQEAQGLNSVFNVDQSTLSIIKKYGREMINLNKMPLNKGLSKNEKLAVYE